MTELKTLKDFETTGQSDWSLATSETLYRLKQEAIKWVKEIEEASEYWHNTDRKKTFNCSEEAKKIAEDLDCGYGCGVSMDSFRIFFNITEEDLK